MTSFTFLSVDMDGSVWISLLLSIFDSLYGFSHNSRLDGLRQDEEDRGYGPHGVNLIDVFRFKGFLSLPFSFVILVLNSRIKNGRVFELV